MDTRRWLLPLAAAASIAGCRGIWDLGDAPDRLAPGDDAVTTSSTGDQAGSASSGSASASTGEGGEGNVVSSASTSSAQGGSGGSTGDGPCGACIHDDACGDVEGQGRCGDDGRCSRAVWRLAGGAKGFADRFVVTNGYVAVAIDTGVADSDEAPGTDNAIAWLDRKTGDVTSYEFGHTTRGALAAGPDGPVAYAPRIAGGGDPVLLRRVEPDGSSAPWPGKAPNAPLRGLRWDADAPGGAAFHAVQSGTIGDRFIRFGTGDFDPCYESADVLAPGRFWATSAGATRVFIADEDALALPLSVLELNDACEEADLATATIDWSIQARPVALAAGPGFVATLLEPASSSEERRIVISTLDGEVLSEVLTSGGRALAVGPGGIYAVRDERLSVFPAAAPMSVTPIAGFDRDEPIVDVEVAGEAIFAVTLGSDDEARLVCSLGP